MSAHAATPNRPSVEADAQRVYEVLKAGGIAICPADIGYAVMTCDPRKLEKIFLVKQRAATKRHAMIGSYAIHKDLHVMTPQHAEIVDHLTQDLGLPLGVIAPFKKDHPMLKAIDDVTMDACAVNGTISILTNAGRFQDELTKRTHADNLPILGSSANLTGTGTKYRIEDINPEILDIADIVINYGLLKWHIHARSSTLIDFSGAKPEIVRIGACYDVIKDVLWRRWQIEIPADPGMAANQFGHLKTPPSLASLEKLRATKGVTVVA